MRLGGRTENRVVRGLVVKPGEGLAFENPTGGTLTFKMRSEGCSGVLTAVEGTAAPGEGPPLHVHDQDEVIYTLDSTFRVKLDGTLHEAPPRSFVFIPRGTPHTWQNIGTELGRFFATVMPATTEFEQFFARYARLPAEERGVEAFVRLAVETAAFQIVGPPVAQSDPL